MYIYGYSGYGSETLSEHPCQPFEAKPAWLFSSPKKLADLRFSVFHPLALGDSLRLWLFKTLDKRLSDSMQPMILVQSASQEVRNSAVLRSP